MNNEQYWLIDSPRTKKCVVVSGILALPLSALLASAALSGEVDQICELKNAEDMILLAGTQWAIASRLAKDPNAPGVFSLVDLQTRQARIIKPDVSSATAEPYSDCPGPPVVSCLITHGLDVRGRGKSPLGAFRREPRRSPIRIHSGGRVP